MIFPYTTSCFRQLDFKAFLGGVCVCPVLPLNPVHNAGLSQILNNSEPSSASFCVSKSMTTLYMWVFVCVCVSVRACVRTCDVCVSV